MREKLPFKYYAIRIGDSVVFRRTVKHITKVQAVLYRPNTLFRVVQVSFTGGKIVATMPYEVWESHGGDHMYPQTCKRITRAVFNAMSPFMLKGEM